MLYMQILGSCKNQKKHTNTPSGGTTGFFKHYSLLVTGYTNWFNIQKVYVMSNQRI